MNLKYAERSEDTEQIAVIQWAKNNEDRHPELKWLYHIPNGGSRNRAEAVKLKQMGVRAGVSDLCLPYPRGVYCGLYIEMKYGSNRLQDMQKEFLSEMSVAGHFVATCYVAEEAIAVIEEYCNLPLSGGYEETYKIIMKYTGDDKMKEGIGRNIMSVPNNAIFKNGKILGGAQD